MIGKVYASNIKAAFDFNTLIILFIYVPIGINNCKYKLNCEH